MNEAAWRAFDREMGKLESGVGKKPRRGKQNRATATSFAYEAPGELVLEDEPLQPNTRASSPARFAPEDAAPEPRGIGERFFQRGWEEQFLPDGQDEPSLVERAGLSGAPRLRPLINPSAASMVAGLEPSGPDITSNNPLYQGREIPLDRQSLARLRGEAAADEANLVDRGALAMEVVNRPAGIVTETADFVGDVLTPWREQSRLDMEDRARYFSRVLPGIGRNITLSDESSPAGQARSEDAEREDLARTDRATAEYLRQRVGPGYAGDGTAMIDPVDVTVPQNYNRLDQQAGRFIDDVFGYQGSRNTADSARRYAIGDALAAETTTSTPVEAADAEVMAQSAAGEHFMRTAPWAIEFAPGIGVLPDLAAAGRGGARAVGRAGWRATFGPNEELPYAFTPRASPIDPPGPATQRYRSDFRNPALAATATYAGIESLDGEGLTAEPLEGAISAGLAAGFLRARGGRSAAPAALRARPSAEPRPIDVDATPTDLPPDAVARPQGGGIGDDVLENLPPAGAERDYSGAWEGSGYDAMRGRIDELEQAPPAPTPAPRAKPSFRAAIRDPETGQVYTGEDHWDAIASAPDDVRPRLEQIYDRPVEDVDNVGFEINGTFMRREEGLQALRDARGRSRPVGIGEQVNRDGTVTPAQPIDWDAPVAPERSALRDLGLGAGIGAIGGGLVGASLMDEAQADDGAGDESDTILPILAAGGIGAALMTMRGRGARDVGYVANDVGVRRRLGGASESPPLKYAGASWEATPENINAGYGGLSRAERANSNNDAWEDMIAPASGGRPIADDDLVFGYDDYRGLTVNRLPPEDIARNRWRLDPNDPVVSATPFRDTFDGSVGMSGGAPRPRTKAESPPSNQRLNGEPQQSENLAGTEADFLAALPRDPAQWREATALHPWINSPSRAQAVIMASARNADGSFVYSTSDILLATGISSENSLSVTLNKAREAGVPVPTRKSGRDGATAPLGGNRLTRIVEIMESAERNGVELTARQIAERAGVSRDAVNVALSQVRTNSAQSARVPEGLRQRVAALDAARAARRRRNTTNATLAGAGIGGALGLGVMEEASAEGFAPNLEGAEVISDRRTQDAGDYLEHRDYVRLADGTVVERVMRQDKETWAFSAPEWRVLDSVADPPRTQVGEYYTNPYDPGMEGAFYLPPAEEDVEPSLISRAALPFAAGLIVRRLATNWGARGVTRDLATVGPALGVDLAQTEGDDPFGSAALALAPAALMRGAEGAAPMIRNAVDDYSARQMARPSDNALLADDNFVNRVRAFERDMLQQNRDIVPRSRALSEDAEMGTVGTDAPVADGRLSAYSEFRNATPGEQWAWMNREGFRMDLADWPEVPQGPGWLADVPGIGRQRGPEVSPEDVRLGGIGDRVRQAERIDASPDPERFARGMEARRTVRGDAAEAIGGGLPPMTRRRKRPITEDTPANVVRRAGTRPAKDTLGGFLEEAQRAGVPIERGRTNAATARNIIRAIRENPQLERIAMKWGLGVALGIGVSGGIGASVLEGPEGA